MDVRCVSLGFALWLASSLASAEPAAPAAAASPASLPTRIEHESPLAPSAEGAAPVAQPAAAAAAEPTAAAEAGAAQAGASEASATGVGEGTGQAAAAASAPAAMPAPGQAPAGGDGAVPVATAPAATAGSADGRAANGQTPPEAKPGARDELLLPEEREASQHAANADERDALSHEAAKLLDSAPPQVVPLPPAPVLEAASAGPLFPSYPVVEQQKQFWIQIFTRYVTNEGVLHDQGLTMPVYGVLDLRGMNLRQQFRFINRRKAEVTQQLRALADALESGEDAGEEGKRLLALFRRDVTPKDLRIYAGDVRFQRGLADRFEKGLIESGAILAEMQRILRENGVPEELAYLPHVESSFNYRAYSKYGAAGIWQFTRGTGKLFMNVRYDVDERLDPFLATAAAAKFLRQNLGKLGTWPLAITAYNHGPRSLENIVARTGTRDLGVLIETYHGRLFRFASKNFYGEFLAAKEVAQHYRAHFGEINLREPLTFVEVRLPFYLDFRAAVDAMGVEAAVLQELNPSLRTPVLVGSKAIPKGFTLRVPPDVTPDEFLAAVPDQARQNRQRPTMEVRVAPGDTLYDLGRRYNVSWQLIAQANHITAYHRLMAGQRVIIPRAPEPGEVVAAAPPPAAQLAAPAAGQGPAQAAPLPASVAVAAAPAAPQVKLQAAAGAVPAAVVAVPARPVARMGANGEAIAFQRADGASLFQDLELRQHDAARRTGQITTAYGETVGHYAEWANVAAQEIRQLNRLRYGVALLPGRRLTIPLRRVGLKEFQQARIEFHLAREEDFFSSYGISAMASHKVQPGETAWQIAKAGNIPMWLFYQQNPKLVTHGLRAGDEVVVPQVEELEVLKARAATTPDTAAVKAPPAN